MMQNHILDVELEKCPCCGSQAFIEFRYKALFDIDGWVISCGTCINSSEFVKFGRISAIESWDKYAQMKMQSSIYLPKSSNAIEV